LLLVCCPVGSNLYLGLSSVVFFGLLFIGSGFLPLPVFVFVLGFANAPVSIAVCNVSFWSAIISSTLGKKPASHSQLF
jgi:hypothetical protein